MYLIYLMYLMYLARTQPDISTQAMVGASRVSTHVSFVPVLCTCIMYLYYKPVFLWVNFVVGLHIVMLMMTMIMIRMAIRHQSSHHRLCNLLILRDWQTQDKLTLAWSLSSVVSLLSLTVDISLHFFLHFSWDTDGTKTNSLRCLIAILNCTQLLWLGFLEP